MMNKEREKRPIRIGVSQSGYPEVRNITGLPHDPSKIHFQRAIDPYKVISYLEFKLLGKVDHTLNNSFWDLGFQKVDLFHFFNGIYSGKKPWLSTFETSLPRWPRANERNMKKGVDRLLHPSCKRLIALSNCSERIQSKVMTERFPYASEGIGSKMTVLHPPQDLRMSSIEEKTWTELPSFTLIGHTFFLKGGLEFLQVVSTLLEEGHQLQVTIVSRLEFGDHASHTTHKHYKEAKALIERHPEIEHYEKLPSSEVHRILQWSWVCLLPTYADTYGYSVLEAQANGCPVISTNIRALPEINPPEAGWTIEVPKDEWENGRIGDKEGRKELSERVQEGLMEHIRSILEDPGQVLEKGQKSLDRIKSDHDPDDRAERMLEIYRKALR